MERNHLIFYRSFYEAIKELPRDIQGEIYTAIMEYALNGNETDNLKPIARSIFILIKPQLDANNQKFKNGCEGAEYGKLGGRPRNNENPNETPKKPQENPNETPNNNDNDNITEITNVISVSNSASSPPPETENIDYKKLIEYFNTQTKGVFGKVNFPISEKRKGMIRARVREHGKKSFVKMIDLAVNSDFLKGSSGKFVATFDWLIKPTNYEKVLSGNFDNRKIIKPDYAD